jgi:ribosomal protein S18 acetylase RimI-like enzyme
MIKIRTAGKDDVSALQKLNHELFLDNQKYDPELKVEWPMSEDGNKYFSELIDRESYVLIAEDNENPVGYLVAEEREVEYRKGKSVFIENMGVSPSSQNKGIGGMLVSELVNLINEKGIKKIYVTTYLKNNKALDFYRKNGFSDIDITLEKVI